MRLRIFLASTAVAIALVACGGGDSNSTASPKTPTTTSTTYQLTADIGDTWLLTLKSDNTYTVAVSQTQYSLASASGTYTQATNGTVTGTGGSTFSLILNSSTGSISGTMTLGGKNAVVAGVDQAKDTSSDTTTLAGDYFFIGATRNASDGSSADFVGGTFRIASNGTTVTLCDTGLIQADGSCGAVTGGGTPNQVALTIIKKNGLNYLQMAGSDFGIMSVQTGTHGPVIAIDRYGNNSSGVMRTGAIYAAKQVALNGTEANGTWSCKDRSATIGTLTVNGTSLTATTTSGSDNETLYYNQVNGSSLVAANGIITSVVNGETVANGVLLLPLTSNLMVVERDEQESIAVCTK